MWVVKSIPNEDWWKEEEEEDKEGMSPSMPVTSMKLHLELDEELIKSLWVWKNGREGRDRRYC